MWRRRLARFFAPLAFLAAVTIAVLLVRAGLRTDDASTPAATVVTTAPATTAPTTRPAPTRPGTTTAARPAAQFYVIEAGDTLDKVAVEHDTTVGRLLELNPGIDTSSLQIGQRIRVK